MSEQQVMEVEEVQQVQEKQPEKPKTVIELSDEGLLKPRTLDEQFRVASMAIASGMVPKGYNTPAQVLAGMQIARELGYGALTGLNYITYVNGRAMIWGEVPLERAMRTGKLEDLEEYYITQNYEKICFENKNLHEMTNVYAAVCIMKHRDMASKRETVFTMDMAKHAGLLGKQSPWKTYPHIMLKRRARGEALKDLFPESFVGVGIAEYDSNHIPDDAGMRNINPDGTEHGAVTRKLLTAAGMNE